MPVSPPSDLAAVNPSSPSDGRPRRNFKKWVQLLLVWLAGLCVWALYLAALVYVVYHGVL